MSSNSEKPLDYSCFGCKKSDLFNKVLWNNEMDLCIGLKTELDRQDFIEIAKRMHIFLTGERLNDNDFIVSENPTEPIWRLNLIF
jgi:hypothetical protein